MFTYPIQTTVHCNRCDKAFQLKRERNGNPIEGQSIARLSEFETCPHCGMTDCHFVYARDYSPTPPEQITFTNADPHVFDGLGEIQWTAEKRCGSCGGTAFYIESNFYDGCLREKPVCIACKAVLVGLPVDEQARALILAQRNKK